MDKPRTQFTFYRSYYEAMRVLPKKEQTAVVLGICAYALDGIEPKLNGTAEAIFMLIRPTLDASRRKSEIGRRGGTSRKQSESKTEANDKQNESKTEAKRKQTASEIENEIEKELEIEYECIKENNTKEKADKPPSAPRFTPPSLDEVSAYCQERNNTVDPVRFVDSYAAKGWMIGKNKMKDWKAAVRTWERGDKPGVARQMQKSGGDRLLDMIRSGVLMDE